jgi:hypothetical protein
METKTLIKSLLIAPAALFASSAMAIPSLQIGDADGGTCESYDQITEDCIVGATFSVTALGAGDAYIAFSAVPKTTIDTFTIAPSGDGGPLSMVDSGFGAPPFADIGNDPTDLSSHGIFDTWFEVWAVDINTGGTICNSDPDDADDCTAGYIEFIDINILSLVDGLHIDLFRCSDGSIAGGDCTVGGGDFAPFSHDATVVPVPAAVWLFGSGLLGLVGIARRHKVA